jgi:hypothetical protein
MIRGIEYRYYLYLKWCIVCLMMHILITYIYAESVNLHFNQPYTQQQMKQKAAQFKAETGFVGHINIDYDLGVIRSMQGVLPAGAVSDTSSAIIEANKIIQKLLPYIRIEMGQLKLERVLYSPDYIGVRFKQSIRGIIFEPYAKIEISFRPKELNSFELSNWTIPDLKIENAPFLSQAEAKGIFDKEISGRKIENYIATMKITNMYVDKQILESSDSRSPEFYRVCWDMPYGISKDIYHMYIDAITGKILSTKRTIPFDDEQICSTAFSMQQMEQKAAQFKTETGFEGTINYDLDYGVFTQMWGRFPTWVVSDTSSARIEAIVILKKLLPYVRTDMNRLRIDRIMPHDHGIFVTFEHTINGLEFEPHSGISIYFRTYAFTEVDITNGIIPDMQIDSTGYITEEEAENIFDEAGQGIRDSYETMKITKSYLDTEVDKKPELYRVCWIIPYTSRAEYFIMYIDALTGKILKTKKVIPF